MDIEKLEELGFKEEDLIMTDEYEYSLRSTWQSSEKYGPCEVCGEHCGEVFRQITWRRFIRRTDGWKGRYPVSDDFGHKGCLLKQRKE